MNGEGGIGAAERDYGLSSWDYVVGFDFYRAAPYFTPDVGVPLGNIYDIISGGISAAQGVPVPEIRPRVTYTTAGLPSTEIDRGEAVLPSVIDPEVGEEVTVFEEEVASRGPVSPRPTNWDEFYDRYVILNPEVPDVVLPDGLPVPPVAVPLPAPVLEDVEVEEPVSVWTDIIEGVGRAVFPLPAAGIDLYRGYNQPPGIVAGPTGMSPPPISPTVTVGGGMATDATCPPTGPKYAKICLATNQIMPLRQRRRRRLLTSSDLSDLAALKALFGNSAGVQAALVKAVRR